MIEAYRWAGGSEASLRFGPAGGPVVMVAPPLFEEANRTRAFLVETLRLLAERGVASVLPDLPGQGESLIATEEARLRHWRAAFGAAAGAAGDIVGTVAIRAGALVDAAAPTRCRWRLSPIDGPALVRELWRARQVTGDRSAAVLVPEQLVGDTPIDLGGNRLAPELLAELLAAAPCSADEDGAARVVRLASDPRSANRKLPGSPPWRRSEPETDIALSQALASDIADWVAACAG